MLTEGECDVEGCKKAWESHTSNLKAVSLPSIRGLQVVDISVRV
jgi:hypothetical protein